MKTPRRIILALGTALILGAGLIFILMEREKAQVQQLQHSEAANAELIKLVELYSQRTTLFLSWVNQIKSKGYDGFMVAERGSKNVAIFDESSIEKFNKIL